MSQEIPRMSQAFFLRCHKGFLGCHKLPGPPPWGLQAGCKSPHPQMSQGTPQMSQAKNERMVFTSGRANSPVAPQMSQAFFLRCHKPKIFSCRMAFSPLFLRCHKVRRALVAALPAPAGLKSWAGYERSFLRFPGIGENLQSVPFLLGGAERCKGGHSAAKVYQV